MEALRERIEKAIKRLFNRHRVDAFVEREIFLMDSSKKLDGA